MMISPGAGGVGGLKYLVNNNNKNKLLLNKMNNRESTRLPDGHLLNKVEFSFGLLDHNLGIGVLVDGILLDGHVASPTSRLHAIRPYATVTVHHDLLALDLDRVRRLEYHRLHVHAPAVLHRRCQHGRCCCHCCRSQVSVAIHVKVI